MKISLNWLGQFIHIEESAAEISERLTFSGLEVEGEEQRESLPGGLKGIVIGEVLSCEQHPNADKLKVTRVDIGATEPVQIVCGASNVAQGQKVVVATVGSTLYPEGGEPFQIKKARLRGEISEGMICAEDEIGLSNKHDGIMVLKTNQANGSPAADYFKPETDTVLEIGLTPNRADAASHLGVARDLKAVYKRKITLPEVSDFRPDNHNLPFKVTVENNDACPRYSGLTLSGVSVKDSPDWLQNRLKSIGLEPINNVVDVTNYVLHELGQPLHAFDADKVKEQHVRVMNLPDKTGFITLDGKERKLTATDLMICDGDANPLCIAGVFGGEHSGVKASTTKIFLESACFSPDAVRKTAQHHGLKTDASFRYERGTDPNMVVFALKRAALLIKEVAGGTISSEIIDNYPEPVEDFVVTVKFRNINRLLGKELDKEEIREILQWLDIRIENETEIGFTAIVPPYRVDVTREADVIEEILRIYGINNIELNEHLGADFLSDHPENDVEKKQASIAAMLADNGYFEIITNSLTKPLYAKQLSAFEEHENVVILNKLSEELEVMRQSLLFTGLDVLAHNINHKQADLKLFEFGKIYQKIKGKYKERKQLGLYLSGNKEGLNPFRKEESVNFNELYAIVLKIFNKLNTEIADKEQFQDDVFEYGLKMMLNDKEISRLGSLHKKLLRQAGIKQSVFYVQFDWEYLMKVSGKKTIYQEVSKFPEVKRDLSLVIDKKVSFDAIIAVARKNAGALLKDIQLFDIYEGDKIAVDQKAYAMTFVLQDKQQTLTDKVIDKTMNRLMKAFETDLGAIIRK